MSNGSYDQFFKKAQTNKRKESTEAQLRSAVRMKRPKAPVPWKAVGGLIFTLGLVTFYLAAPDAVMDLWNKVEINAIGSAGAAEGKAAGKSSEAGAKVEKAAAKDVAANPDKGLITAGGSIEDVSHFDKLKQRKEELDLREKELVELEEELQKQKVELDKRILQLEDMRNQIAAILKDRVEIDQEKVNKLVDLYSNMKPKQAADVIGSINEDLAVEVLAKMKKKSAAEIMNLLPPEKARVLSEKYTGYRRSHTEPKG